MRILVLKYIIKNVCFLSLAGLVFIACNEKKMDNNSGSIQGELDTLNHLLKDRDFAIELAQAQEAAYYNSQGQEIPDFFDLPDKTVLKSFADEKIAINYAGFIALECGVGYLVSTKGETPIYWIRKIAENELSEDEWLVLNRFANATWKASQPFRSLERIEKENFISANFLSKEEIEKDRQQISSAAQLVLEKLESNQDSTLNKQLESIKNLMQDKDFASEMGAHLEAAYFSGIGEVAPTFLDSTELNKTIEKDALEEKIAINMAGFYALETGLSYFVQSQDLPPSDILDAISKNSLITDKKNLFLRLANATWKASQPFRSMDRIQRPNFIPFDLLSESEVEKDWVQIKSAGELVLEHFGSKN